MVAERLFRPLEKESNVPGVDRRCDQVRVRQSDAHVVPGKVR